MNSMFFHQCILRQRFFFGQTVAEDWLSTATRKRQCYCRFLPTRVLPRRGPGNGPKPVCRAAFMPQRSRSFGPQMSRPNKVREAFFVAATFLLQGQQPRILCAASPQFLSSKEKLLKRRTLRGRREQRTPRNGARSKAKARRRIALALIPK